MSIEGGTGVATPHPPGAGIHTADVVISPGASTATIQAAIGTSGRDVFIKAGNYTITGALAPASNVRMRGAGRGITNLIHSGHADDMFDYGVAPITNFELADMTLDQNAAVESCIDLGGALHVHPMLKRLELIGMPAGLQASIVLRGTEFEIEDITCRSGRSFINASGIDERKDGYFRNIIYIAGPTSAGGGGAIAAWAFDGVVIDGLRVINSAGALQDAVSLGDTGVPNGKVTIRDLYVEGFAGGNAVNLSGLAGGEVEIVNPICEGAGITGGTSAPKITVIGGSIRDTLLDGIDVDRVIGMRVIGTRFDNCGRAGIDLGGSLESVLSGVEVYNCTTDGVHLVAQFGAQPQFNRIDGYFEGNGGWGVHEDPGVVPEPDENVFSVSGRGNASGLLRMTGENSKEISRMP